MNTLTMEAPSKITPKEKGDSLELAVEHIFSVAGFKTSRNVWIAKYEIDVVAEVGDRKVIVECKNYQNGSLTIRNLIHQWHSKNQIIRAHKIIIALAGLVVKDSDYALAAEFDIELWSQDDISEMFNLSLKPDELRKKLIEKIDFRPITIAERYRDDITYLVIKPLLSIYDIPEEGLFRLFNRWLRAHILTELQMTETNASERSNLIELFEGSKTKKRFLNLVKKKRKEVEYWDTVYEQLKSHDVLSRERQDYYLSHMNDLLCEYADQKIFFRSDDYMARIRKLISSRLQNALLMGQFCSFTTSTMNNHVKVFFEEEGYVGIYITGISEAESNVLNWIMTSQCSPQRNENGEIISYRWWCSSLNDATEKLYRIFTEYYEISEKNRLKDEQIK
ncbi:restriction endonuclease [Marinifilum fragile]|uniref:restriction endonuclease n=1 Tax=Marinifilum fragile TaxID=570161 RepID=UPI002AA7CC58|nr:restriction endonuclease [Marinifilum fragile]